MLPTKPPTAFLILSSLLLLTSLCVSSNFNVIASGFAWAENLVFDGTGNLFVSDAMKGEVWRIFRNDNGTYEKQIHLQGYAGSLGLVATPDGSTLYVVSQKKKGGESKLLKMSTSVPLQHQEIADLPKCGNGLALHFKSGRLFSTTEGFFLPKAGEVFEVNVNDLKQDKLPVKHAWSHLYAADGAYIDQERGLLYVSQVLGSQVLVYSLEGNGTLVRSFRAPPNVSMLDDYWISEDGSTLYGADFWHGNVVSFNTDGTSSGDAKIILSNVTSPTSARRARGKGFDSKSLFVTEGGGLSSSTNNRRLLEITNVFAD